MAPLQLLLDHDLKALRLPTFHREYDKVAQQCADEAVDYPRYLFRLNRAGVAGPGAPCHRAPHQASALSSGQEPGQL